MPAQQSGLLKPVRSVYRLLRKSKVFQNSVGRLGVPLNPDKWIFVVGCYNSGTSLLSRLIQQHPECAGASNEGVVLTTEMSRPEDYGWPRNWLYCEDKLRIDPQGTDAQNAALLIKRQWSFTFDKHAPVIVEKSISNSARIPFLASHFNPSFFVHIVRDGVAVAEGIRRKSFPSKYDNPVYADKYPLELCFNQWSKSNQIIADDLSRPDMKKRSCVVKYEDLCDHPEVELERIHKLCGLVTDVDSNDSLISEEVENMNWKSYEALSSEEISLLRRIGINEMKTWGYNL